MTVDKRKIFQRRDNNPYGLGKLPPQAPDAEEAVLGALMLESKVIHLHIAIIKPEAFYKDSHRLICEAILKLHKSNRKIDLIQIRHELSNMGKLEEVGGAYALTELTNRVANSSNVGLHLNIINYYYQLREIIRCGTDMVNEGYDTTNNPYDLITKGVQFMNDLKNLNVQRTEKNMNELMQLMMNEINRPKTDSLLGLSSGSIALDKITQGWQPGQLIIPAARPAMGKTADLCSQVAHIGYKLKKPVGVFSLEMSSVQLTFRIAANLSGIPQKKLKYNDLTDQEQLRLGDYVAQISDAPIFMDDTAAISIDELEAKATLLKALYDIQILFIDYLQLITVKNAKPGNREGDVSDISRRLKALAKNLGIPIVALCQLSRAVESRDKTNYLPKLSDLRESGSIEQDADIVYFLWRPEYYEIKEAIYFPRYELNIDVKNLIVKKVAKCREEEPGLVPGHFQGDIMQVRDHQQYLDKISAPVLPFTPIIKPSISDDDDMPF